MPKSGHFLPADYYAATKAYLDDYVNNQALTCLGDDTYESCRVVDEMCAAMNDCNGNGECGDNGQCTCDADYKGADCSYRTVRTSEFDSSNSSVALSTTGTAWLYFQQDLNLTENEDWEMSFESAGNANFTIYVSFGVDSNPNEFDFDIVFKNMPGGKTVTLS